jgi:hypothetical protein
MPLILAELKKPKNDTNVLIDLISAIGYNVEKADFPEAVPLIAVLLKDKDEKVRAKVLVVLWSYQSKLVKPYQGDISKIIQSPASRAELETALQTMASVDPADPTLHEGLKKLLASNDPKDREKGIGIIGMVSTPIMGKYLKSLPAFLDDPDDKVRKAAIIAMRMHLTQSDSEILNKLKNMAEFDPNKHVRDSALRTYQEAARIAPKSKQ